MTRGPNILLITTDQQRWDTVAAMSPQAWVRTPALDRLAGQGTSFPLAFTPTPVCMTARVSLLTGRYSTSHRFYSNHHRGPRPQADLFSHLRRAGYRTALIGKNHTYLHDADLDVFSEHPAGRDTVAREQRRVWEQDVRRVRYPRVSAEPAPGGLAGDPDHARAEAAIDFIRAADPDRPWVLWMSLLAPHTPYVAPEPFFSMYDGVSLPPPAVEADGLERKPLRQRLHAANIQRVGASPASLTDRMRRVYAGAVSMVDRLVGQVLAALDESDHRRRNTLVLFTSDHGDYQGDHGLLTKSPALYDCLIRVPLIARWPGVWDAGGRDERLVSLLDLLPTACDAAGIAPPTDVHGHSLLGPTRRDAVYCEYGVPGVGPCGEDAFARLPQLNPGEPRLPWEGNPLALAGRIHALRTRDWKLVHEPGGTDELYDLAADPNELNNLAPDTAFAAKRRALLEQLSGVRATFGPHPSPQGTP